MTTYATTTDILDAYAALDDEQLAGLRKTASLYIHQTRFSEPLDLIHEVLHLMLEGRRNWPLHVDFCMCVVMVAHSVADAHRQRKENAPGARQDIDDVLARDASLLGGSPSVEDELIAMENSAVAQRMARAIRPSLADDQDGQRVLNGLLAGMSPKETCESFGLSPKAFDAAKHRVMRRLKNEARLH